MSTSSPFWRHRKHVCAVLLVVGACSKDAEVKKSLGAGCLVNSDCAASLVCSFERCHEECRVSKDCPTGTRCVQSEDRVGVCLLAEENPCDYTSDCPIPLVCAGDFECRNECKSARDCVQGQTCAGEGVCAEPNEVGESGNLIGAEPQGSAGAGNAGGTSGNTGGENPSSGGRGDSGGAAGESPDGGAGGIDGIGGAGGVSGCTENDGGGAGQGGDGRTDGTEATGGAAATAGSSGSPTSGVAGGIDATGGAAGAPAVSTGCGVVTTTRYFCDDFEGDMDQWEAGGSWGPTTERARSGNRSFTDSPNEDYVASSYSSTMTRNPIDLSDAVAPLLQFWHLAAVDSDHNGDTVAVEVSIDGGFEWTRLQQWSDPRSLSWSVVRLDLSAAAGSSNVYLRFVLDAYQFEGTFAVHEGWYIDDVEVRELN